MPTPESKFIVAVQTTTILNVNGQQQFEMIVLETNDYPTIENGWLRIVGKRILQQGTEAKVVTFLFPPTNLKWCIVESKASADIIIPRVNIPTAR